ncbi:MAG: DUF4126 domain-containing protein [Hydrogenophaga sp.]|uniref:DUF4126 domain-containing protein n=1 Tax=Hydrogenophaga sp. TaxID=1904254 RepID=UPI001DF76246|nr:DUF4126 domain-containing protein [Hydrogenophaga sp.]MBX3611213.1 DUF4126 domain-containing protein [Hydrogenophaga sp.]
MNDALQSLDTPALLALAAALGWASGLRLYLAVFLTGLAGTLGWIELPPGLKLLQHPGLLGLSGVLLFIEFFADKLPWLDSLWDMANSVIRVPAGAALAAGALGADGPTMAVIAALLGGTLAATSQAAKTSTRAAINTSPEPFTNIGASLLEDGLVVAALWLATQHPLLFAVLLVFMVLAMWAITWLLFKFLRAAWRRVFAIAPKEV